jgi:NAD(P)H-dependent FMN reductase
MYGILNYLHITASVFKTAAAAVAAVVVVAAAAAHTMTGVLKRTLEFLQVLWRVYS